MGSEENQQKIHKFLCEHFKSQESFAKDDLWKDTTWSKNSQDTYRSKQLSQFIKEESKGVYKVGRRFASYLNWDKFQREIVTQNRDSNTVSKKETFTAVLNFEFFMPLAHEVLLRKLLDNLFFSDSLQLLLATLDKAELEKKFPARANEEKDAYWQRLMSWLADKFGGYSISHVSGRFRAQSLMSREDAAKKMVEGDDPYLIDETTAVVRFIVPCGTGSGEDEIDPFERPSETVVEEAKTIRWFFGELFVQSMLEAVQGEKQIWMLESGLFSRLHIWSTEEQR